MFENCAANIATISEMAKHGDGKIGIGSPATAKKY
jgi:hypothetical protein